MKTRKLTPEILDHLPAGDPEAIRSRLDLKRINGLAGNYRWLKTQLGKLMVESNLAIIELGAGDGTFAKYLAATMPEADYTALDLAPRPKDFPGDWQWKQQDIFDGLKLQPNCVVVANLFLHHFTDEQLAQLGESLSQCRGLVFCEPERHIAFRGLGYLAQAALRFNRVTRHDMHVSIEAGFKNDELIKTMGLDDRDNRLEHSAMGFYRLVSTA